MAGRRGRRRRHVHRRPRGGRVGDDRRVDRRAGLWHVRRVRRGDEGGGHRRVRGEDGGQARRGDGGGGAVGGVQVRGGAGVPRARDVVSVSVEKK